MKINCYRCEIFILNFRKDSEDNLAKSMAEFNERMENHQNTLEKLKTKVENQKAGNSKKEHEIQGKKYYI